jgi:sugar lactone lactonase YvrE
MLAMVVQCCPGIPYFLHARRSKSRKTSQENHAMNHPLQTLVSLSLLFSLVFSNLPTLIARAADRGALPVASASRSLEGTPTNFPLYAANFNNANLVRLDSGGGQALVTSGGSLSYSFSAAADSHGYVYVGDLFNGIIKVSPAGVQSSFATISSIPYGMAFDGSGNLFVVDSWKIIKVTPAGVKSEFASGGYISDVATGLAFDSHGNLYVANYESAENSVVKISPTGQQSVFTEGGNITDPWALAFDSSDNLYVTEFNNISLASSIIKVSPAGVQSVFATGGNLNNPRALAFDRNGDLYAGNYSGTGIVKIDPAGNQTLFASGGDLYSPVGLAFGRGNLAAALDVSPNPSTFGQTITITAVLTGSSGIISGTLAFEDGGAAIPGCEAVALDGSGKASCTTAAISAGAHTIHTVFSGDDNYPQSTSAPYSQVVNRAATTTTLTSAPDPSVYGQSVTFTATVTAALGVPGGLVTFYDDAVSLGSGALNAGGVATFTTSSLSAGIHPALSAAYQGDANDTASASSAYSHTVDRAEVAISLASSPRPSTFGQMVTLTTTVAAEPPGAGAPTGAITLTIDAHTLVIPLDGSGRAVTMTDTLPVGSHPVGAAYPGDPNFKGNSGTLAGGQTVTDAPVTGLTVRNDGPTAIGGSPSLRRPWSPAAMCSTPGTSATGRRAPGSRSATATAWWEPIRPRSRLPTRSVR